MTDTTPDERILRRAANAIPVCAHARLLLADALQEQGREREACVERIAAEPWNDTWRLQLADVCERTGQREQGEFVRVQVQLDRLVGVPDGHPRCGSVSDRWCPECGDCICRNPESSLNDHDCPLHGRYSPHAGTKSRLGYLSEKSLRLRHQFEPRLRAVLCPVCLDGTNAPYAWGGSGGFRTCPGCGATGDAGGLLEKFDSQDDRYTGGAANWVHKVHWRRGCPERIECKLADVLERVHGNRHGEMDAVRWRVTEWAKRVARWHAVLEFWVTDRESDPSARWFKDHGRDKDTPFHLPDIVFDALTDGASVSHPGTAVVLRLYESSDAAKFDLATALARLARAALAEDPP